jgi:hypothetical protein
MCYRERAEACDIGTVAKHVDVGRLDRALSVPLLPLAIPKTRHSDSGERTLAGPLSQVDLPAGACPGTGRPTLRQKAAKRGSSL